MIKNMNFAQMLDNIGLSRYHNILLHCGYKAIRNSFPGSNASTVISNLKNVIDPRDGSIIMPAFTYCFKKADGSHEVFDRKNSKSKVGYISEEFRKSRDVIRTSSPTHSFSLWGKVTKDITPGNNPESPLGAGSIMEWLSKTKNSYMLMLGTDFTAFTMGHYLEIIANVPWYDYSPWEYMGVKKIGVSNNGEIEFKEVPGCAKPFVEFENYLLENNFIMPFVYGNLRMLYISVETLLKYGKKYFSNSYKNLLCIKGNCKACDSRREKFQIY